MKVKDLRRALEGVADDIEVVMPGDDHSYNRVREAHVTDAEKQKNYLGEWHGAEHASEGAACVKVFVVGQG